MTISAKRTIGAVGVATAMSSLPFVFERLPIQPSLDAYIQPCVGFLMLPGLILSVILAGGNVHTYSLGVVEVTNFCFYGLVTYFVAGKIASRRMKAIHRAGRTWPI